MDTIMCNQHRNGTTVAAARARVHVSTGLAAAISWGFATKPYGDQRPSGAPPG